MVSRTLSGSYGRHRKNGGTDSSTRPFRKSQKAHDCICKMGWLRFSVGTSYLGTLTLQVCKTSYETPACPLEAPSDLPSKIGIPRQIRIPRHTAGRGRGRSLSAVDSVLDWPLELGAGSFKGVWRLIYGRFRVGMIIGITWLLL